MNMERVHQHALETGKMLRDLAADVGRAKELAKRQSDDLDEALLLLRAHNRTNTNCTDSLRDRTQTLLKRYGKL